jgi:hypothetical protein
VRRDLPRTRVANLTTFSNIRKDFPMTARSTSADFVTAFATGWPENQPEIMVLSLTTHKGVQDFAFSREQALLVAKTVKQTALRLAEPKADR